MRVTPDISVIVPFYNAEATFERTLNSLAAQSLETVEYLFINDGCTDSSVQLLHAFMSEHPDFKGTHRLVSSNKNRGTAHAIALGIQNATGRYIMRCDADDVLEPETLRVMLAATEQGRYDAVVAPLIYDYGNRQRIARFDLLPQSLNDMAIDTLHFSLCNKLLRRRLFASNNLLPYDRIDCWEDVGVVARFMALSPKVKYINMPMYHYMVDPRPSLSRTKKARLLRDHLNITLLLERWFVEHDCADKYAEFLTRLKFFSKVKMLRGRDKNVRRWKSTFSEVNKQILSIRRLKWYWRILFYSVVVVPTPVAQFVATCCRPFYRAKK